MQAQARFVFLSMALLAVVACGNNHVTLDLTGGPETIGATVYVNGEKVGTMTKFTDNSSRFAKSIPTGRVVLEVKKEGFLPFNESISISSNEGERYLVVTLKPEGKKKVSETVLRREG